MTEAVDSLLNEAVAKLKEQEAAVVDTKKFINQLLAFAKREPMYRDLDVATTTQVAASLKGDEYVGQTQHKAARMVLERRKALGLGPATQDEMWVDLVAGGYRSSAKTEAIAKQILQQTLSQNSGVFHRIPNGKWGLVDWYPEVKRKAKTAVPPAPGSPSKAADIQQSAAGGASQPAVEKPVAEPAAEGGEEATEP